MEKAAVIGNGWKVYQLTDSTGPRKLNMSEMIRKLEGSRI